MSRYQRGHVYEAFNAFHVQYYQTELRDGQQIRVRRSHRLCARLYESPIIRFAGWNSKFKSCGTLMITFQDGLSAE